MHSSDQPGRSTAKFTVSVRTLAIVAALAFLIGFVPMWWRAETRGRDLRDLSSRHADLQLETTLARAAVLARQGEYEAAREAASQFFTELNRQMIADDGQAAPSGALRESLTERDEFITMLARSDPAAADRLAALYMTFRSAQPLR